MPTTRPRYLLTETDELASAIDTAAKVFPDQSRVELVRRLIEFGVMWLEETHERHREAVRDLAGRYPGLYGEGYRDRLRDEWPE